MGLVEFKSKVSGDVVKAEFPLAEMPDLVSFEGDASGHMAKADFLSQFTQVLPELPKTDTANVPTVPVSSTPGNPVAAPAPQSFGERLESKINVLANYLSSELGGLKRAFDELKAAHPALLAEFFKVHDRLARLESLLESKGAPPAAPETTKTDEPKTE